MPSYVVAAAGDQGSSRQDQQIQQLNNQIQQITSQIQQLNQRQQASESQWGQIQQRFEQMIVDVGATVSTLQTRLAGLEAGQPDRVVLFELKERVALFEGKEKEKLKKKTSQEQGAKYVSHRHYL